MGSASRSGWANVLAFASVLTTVVGVAMAVDGGPGGSAPKWWDCSTTQHCSAKPKKWCAAGTEGCCQGTGAAAAINCVPSNTCNTPDQWCF